MQKVYRTKTIHMFVVYFVNMDHATSKYLYV